FNSSCAISRISGSLSLSVSSRACAISSLSLRNSPCFSAIGLSAAYSCIMVRKARGSALASVTASWASSASKRWMKPDNFARRSIGGMQGADANKKNPAVSAGEDGGELSAAPLFLFRGVRGGGLGVLVLELLEAAGQIEVALLARVERVALRAEFDQDRGRGRAGVMHGAAGAARFDHVVGGVGGGFHGRFLGWGRRRKIGGREIYSGSLANPRSSGKLKAKGAVLYTVLPYLISWMMKAVSQPAEKIRIAPATRLMLLLLHGVNSTGAD